MKIYKYKIPLILWFVEILIFLYQIRSITISIITNINLLVYIVFLYELNKRLYRLESLHKIRPKLLSYVYIIIGTILIIFVKANGWPIYHKIKMACTFILPAVFLFQTLRMKIWKKYIYLVQVS